MLLNNENKKTVKPEAGYTRFSTRSARIPQAPNISRAGVVGFGKRLSFLLLPIVCLLLGIGGGWLGAKMYEADTNRVVSTAAKQRIISSESELISDIAKNVGQSVVSVNVESSVTRQDAFGFTQAGQQESAGTGFIINSDGTIMTNRHVVPATATNVSVTMADGTRFDDVEIIGRTSANTSLDVAFLKIKDVKGKKLIPATLGDSSKAEVGDKVVAIGNALGQFQNTVTSGIISGFGRDVTAADNSGNAARLNDLIQTDAAINQGNSGGPLVNINGEVIGINTAVAGEAQNIGFAIPINDTKGLISSVLETGQLRQSYLGVRYVSLTDDLAYQYNLDIKRGAYIIPATAGEGPSVLAGSPAEKAGLREKDIVLKINNITIDDKTSLTSALSRFKVGDKVTLQISRAGKAQNVQVTLEQVPEN